MENLDIHDWQKIKNDFEEPDLLLGNGFTLQFSSQFSYSSLFQEFLNYCDDTHKLVFNQFCTSNFELILKHLTHAKKVNEIFQYPTEKIVNAIKHLKEGLIKVIEDNHPRKADIDFTQLENIARKLIEFGDIFTTNYDLYLYHIIMKSGDIKFSRPHIPDYIEYQDYFWGSYENDKFNQFVDFQNYKYKNIYYLHGALFIFKKGVDTLKLKKDRVELIDAIANEIRCNNLPLFISEGTSEEKHNRIKSNPYLKFCFDKFSESITPLVIIGSSLGEFDNHILNVIKNTRRPIIYGIHCASRPKTSIYREIAVLKESFEGHLNNLKFVDSGTVFQI